MVASISSSDTGFAPQSRVPQMLIASIIPAAVASVIVLARFYSRAILLRNWGYDDSWILLSWFLGGIALTTTNAILTARATGTQTTENLILSMRLGFASRELYQVCIGTTKLGICAFYLRIFQDRMSKIIIRGTMGFVVLFTVGLSAGIFFQCKPISGAWSDVPAVCGNQDPGIIATVIVNILSDLILLVFVIPRILGLNISKQQKISLLSIVSLGILVIVAAAMRATFTLQVLNTSDAQPWDSYQIAIWSAVEVNSGLICASAPAIKPILRKIAPMLLGPPPVPMPGFEYQSGSRKRNTYSSNPISFLSAHYRDACFKPDGQSDIEAVRNKTVDLSEHTASVNAVSVSDRNPYGKSFSEISVSERAVSERPMSESERTVYEKTSFYEKTISSMTIVE